jgi:hypothetical protein
VTPEKAAAAILAGIKANRYLVFTSRDIAVGYRFQRKFAWPYELAMRLLNHRLDAALNRPRRRIVHSEPKIAAEGSGVVCVPCARRSKHAVRVPRCLHTMAGRGPGSDKRGSSRRQLRDGLPRRLLSPGFPLEPPSLQFLCELQDDVEPSGGRRVGQSPRERHVHGIDFARGSTARQHAARWLAIRHLLVHR